MLQKYWQKCKINDFSHTKFMLLLIFVLKLNTSFSPWYSVQQIYSNHFKHDLEYCRQCFEHQTEKCLKFYELIEYDNSSFYNYLRGMRLWNAKREVLMLQLNKPFEKVIGKYFRPRTELAALPSKQLTISNLRNIFENSNNLEGLQFCAKTNITKFVQHLSRISAENELTTWLHLQNNVQPILLPLLKKQEFPIPPILMSCGFSIIQQNVGNSLIHFYSYSFEKKLKISLQLLEAALKFSNGFLGYRLYITDMTADNIVYNTQQEQLYFVDLDSLFIADSASYSTEHIHRHEYIECEDCFAYTPEDLCSQSLSDVNLFLACQLLRENLRKERHKGFLYPIPVNIQRKHPKLELLLKECVYCKKATCTNRFAASLELIKLFKKLLKDYKK